jgi:hypothetical protein
LSITNITKLKIANYLAIYASSLFNKELLILIGNGV